MAPQPSLPRTAKHTLAAHKGPAHIARYSAEGLYCVSGGADKTVRLWNASKGTLIAEYTGHGWDVADLCVAPGNAQFASCGGDKQVYYWDVSTKQTLRRYAGHLHRVNCVAFNFDGTVLASGSFDTKVNLWDCRSLGRVPIQVLGDAKDSVTSLQIATHEILASSVDGHYRIYDLRMGRLVQDFIGHPVTSVCFSSDGHTILASSLDSTLRLFDKQDGCLLNSYSGHTNTTYVIRAALSQNDTYVVSGSEDGSVVFWDLVEGAEVGRIGDAHGGRCVASAAWHPSEAKEMVTAGFDGKVVVWE